MVVNAEVRVLVVPELKELNAPPSHPAGQIDATHSEGDEDQAAHAVPEPRSLDQFNQATDQEERADNESDECQERSEDVHEHHQPLTDRVDVSGTTFFGAGPVTRRA